MTSPTPDIPTLAGELSEEERQALDGAELDGNIGRYFSRFISMKAGRGLIKKRLATAVWSGVMLSDLGLALRDHLRKGDENA